MSSLKLGLKKVDETRRYTLDGISHDDLTSKKYNKTCQYLIYVEHLFILVSTVTGCVSFFAFASLVCVPVGISSSAVGIKLCAITAGIKKCNSIIRKKKKKKHDRIVLLGKPELDTFEILLFKALIDSCIRHDEFVSVDIMLREYSETEEEIKSPEISMDYTI